MTHAPKLRTGPTRATVEVLSDRGGEAVGLRSAVGNQAALRRRGSAQTQLAIWRKCADCQDENKDEEKAAVPPFIQKKLPIGAVDDPLEREADEVSGQVMNIADSASPARGVAMAAVQRRGLAGGQGVGPAPPIVHDVIRQPGAPLNPELREFFEPRFGYDFGSVRVHDHAGAAESAQAVNALAYTVGPHVVFQEGAYSPGTHAGRRLLAHELTHVVQQGNGMTAVQREPYKQTPQDKATVAAAKQRLKVLEPQLAAAEGRKLDIESERLGVLNDRKNLDANAADPFAGLKAQTEDSNMSKLNRGPVDVKVSATEVSFAVKFHVRFEDSSMDSKFDELKTNLQAGIDLVWKQKLGGVFSGRSFTIKPTFALISNKDPRDQNFWLITVRKVSTGAKVTYSGCSLPQPDPNIATSVTDPMCDGGVMSIPPSHTNKPGVLGHELLHLFGLLDRYIMITRTMPGKKPTFSLTPTRETGGRPDPLGGEDGTILREDLGYLFDNFGVYSAEDARNQPGLGFLTREVERLREIVTLGYDPNSLVRGVIRKDFIDKVIKDGENN